MDGFKNAWKMQEGTTCLANYKARAATSSGRPGGGSLGHAIILRWPFDLKPRPTLMTTAPTPSHRDQTSGLKPFCPSPGILEMGYL